MPHDETVARGPFEHDWFALVTRVARISEARTVLVVALDEEGDNPAEHRFGARSVGADRLCLRLPLFRRRLGEINFEDDIGLARSEFRTGIQLHLIEEDKLFGSDFVWERAVYFEHAVAIRLFDLLLPPVLLEQLLEGQLRLCSRRACAAGLAWVYDKALVGHADRDLDDLVVPGVARLGPLLELHMEGLGIAACAGLEVLGHYGVRQVTVRRLPALSYALSALVVRVLIPICKVEFLVRVCHQPGDLLFPLHRGRILLQQKVEVI